MILKARRTRKKSESQMGFEPTTFRDLVGCSNYWATADYGEQGSICWVSTETTLHGYKAKFINFNFTLDFINFDFSLTLFFPDSQFIGIKIHL